MTSLRGDLQQTRDDRDRQLFQVQALSSEVVKYKECAGKSIAELDSFSTKMNTLEVCFSEHSLTINILAIFLIAIHFFFVSQLACVKMSKLNDCRSSWHLQKRS